MTLNKFIKELKNLKKEHGGDLFIEIDFKRDEDGFIILPMNYNIGSVDVLGDTIFLELGEKKFEKSALFS